MNLDGLPVRSQKEVAKLLGISRQAVAKTERRALRKLRERLALDAVRLPSGELDSNRPEELPARLGNAKPGAV